MHSDRNIFRTYRFIGALGYLTHWLVRHVFTGGVICWWPVQAGRMIFCLTRRVSGQTTLVPGHVSKVALMHSMSGCRVTSEPRLET